MIAFRAEGMAAVTSSLWGDLTPGPYAVGVMVLEQTDSTRSPLPIDSVTTTHGGRPLPIVVWYPATASSRARIMLREYVELTASSLGAAAFTPERRRQAVEGFVVEAVGAGASRSRADSILMLPMQAVRDAPRSAGRFPLVVFLHSTPWGAALMSEYLASHGLIVAAIQSKGAREPAYRLSRENVDAMVEDAMFTIGRMRREVDITPSLGVIGMSNGSIAAMALELKLKEVRPDAVVSLDGGIAERAGGTYLAERSMGDPKRFTVPLLHLYTPDNAHLDLKYLRSYEASPRILARVDHLRHGDFLTGGALERLMPGRTAPKDAAVGFSAVCRYTLRFLRWRLANDAGARRFMEQSPETNGVPAGLMEIERLPARDEEGRE